MTGPDISISMPEPTSTDEWIAHLIAAVWRLDSPKLLTLARVLGESSGSPGAAILRSELAVSTGEATHLARLLASALGGRGGGAVREAMASLTTLARVRDLQQESTEQVEIVCTAPAAHGVAVRATFGAAVEMVAAAREQILVIGYVFTGGAAKLVREVAKARQERQVRVTIVGNRMADVVPALRAAWPRQVRPPAIFSREPDSADLSALHAKVLVCDGSVALVTSANFSRRGLHDNVEIGVKVRSPSVRKIVAFVRAMIENGEVLRVRW